MFWLDGSSTLPFTIVSTSFVSKGCVEFITERPCQDFKILGQNWGFWPLVPCCQWACWSHKSPYRHKHLIPILGGIIIPEWEAPSLFTIEFTACRLSDILMFERACKHLFATSKITDPPLTTLSPHRDYSVNRHSLSGSTETGAHVTTLSLVLPHHTTTTSTIPQQLHPVLHPKSTCDTDTQLQWTLAQTSTTPLPVASHNGENRLRYQFANGARASREVRNRLEKERKEVEGRAERGSEEKERRKSEEQQEWRRRPTPSKPSTPPPPVAPPLQQASMGVPDPPMSHGRHMQRQWFHRRVSERMVSCGKKVITSRISGPDK
jgi:hypothetical protein